MTKVDSEQFRLQNVQAALDDGLAVIDASDAIGDDLKKQFHREGTEWVSLLRDTSVTDFEFMRAWGADTLQRLEMLNIVLSMDADEWERWHARARICAEQVDTHSWSSTPSTRSPAAEELDAPALRMLGAAGSYDVDLPDTPARWRSVSELRRRRPERVAEVEWLVASVRRAAEWDVMKPARDDFGSQLRTRLESQAISKITMKPANFEFVVTSAHPQKARVSGQIAHSAMPRKAYKILDDIEDLTSFELNEFVKSFVKKFDITALPAQTHLARPVETSTSPDGEVDVILANVGDRKIQVIKTIRDFTSLGLGEAKAIVDNSPHSVVFEGVSAGGAEKIKTALEDAGATVILRRTAP